MNITVSIPTDEDGFISQVCLSCRRRFKVKFGEGSDKPVGFCPYCAKQGDDWFTESQHAYFVSAVNERVVGPMLDDFASRINRMNRSRGLVRVGAEITHDPPAPEPIEPEEDWPIVTFSCCDEPIKHDGNQEVLHCIICGQAASGGTAEPSAS